MGLIELLVLIVVAGLVFYLVRLLPIEPEFQNLARIVILVALILYLLAAIGVLPGHILRAP